jgi:hypothetical protein
MKKSFLFLVLTSLALSNPILAETNKHVIGYIGWGLFADFL